jgi:CheY-like chemotaxis protein
VTQPYHVIIADDDATVRAVLTRIVKRTYPAVIVSAVPDGLDALLVYDQQGADLVITNQTMRQLYGLDLIAALRARQATIPIILISGDSTHEQPALTVGATLFVAKPFNRIDLVQQLTRLLPP